MSDFSVKKGLEAIIDFGVGLFTGDKGDPRGEARYSGGARSEDSGGESLTMGFIKKGAQAYKGTMEAVSDIQLPEIDDVRIDKGSSVARGAGPLAGIRDSRIQLAIQTAMRRTQFSNPDFGKLMQGVPQPRPVRRGRTLGIEPARLPQATKSKIAQVRKEPE